MIEGRTDGFFGKLKWKTYQLDRYFNVEHLFLLSLYREGVDDKFLWLEFLSEIIL